MKLKNIEISDSKVVSCTIKSGILTLVLENAFENKSQTWVGETTIRISNWQSIICQMFRSSAPFTVPQKIEGFTLDEIDFEFVQEKAEAEGTLMMKGFQRNNGNWIEICFDNPKVEIVFDA